MIIKDLVLDILFPKFCVDCGAEGKYICAKCSIFISEAMQVCPNCCNSSFFGETHQNCIKKYALDGLTSIWDYEGLIKKLIYEIKYNGFANIINECVESSFKLIAKDINRFYPFLSFLYSNNTYISYVPMYLKREKKRGFNQAKLIAQEIGLVSNRKIVSLLKKTTDTESQARFEKEERMENVKNCFSLINQATSDRQVILVDDVFITGTTMRECCRVLKKAGAKKVWGFTLARTA